MRVFCVRHWRLKLHGAARHDRGNGVLVHHLRHGVAQQNDILVKGLNLPLQLDAIDQIDRYGHMLKAQLVQKWVLQELAFFVIHDISSVLVIEAFEGSTRAGGHFCDFKLFCKEVVTLNPIKAQ